MAHSSVFFAAVLTAFVVGTCQAWFYRPQSDTGCRRYPDKDDYNNCVTCNLFRPKEVTLRVRNLIREPTFEETVTLNCTRYKTLFYMMQDAAEANSVFRFSATYDHAGHPGFFVNAFNGVYSNWTEDRTWWQILDGDLNLTPVGISTYEPSAGETVTFNLTQGGH
ncbi:cobalamin binding intrinsic factor-like isoform X1 [Littorina saxatilis]|uniref:DUF4430 domain-containing protein n=1 Tax=Littorina saxatilis TaxID=31220 RepID=A0AAN9BP16_9CAEN